VGIPTGFQSNSGPGIGPSAVSSFTGLSPRAGRGGDSLRECLRDKVRHYLDLITRVAIYAVRFQAGFDKLPAITDRIEQLINPAAKQSPVNTRCRFPA